LKPFENKRDYFSKPTRKKIAAFVKNELPFGRFGKVEEIANVVVFLASGRASWVSGACINVEWMPVELEYLTHYELQITN